MGGVPGQQFAAGHAARAAGIDRDEMLARGDAIHLTHVDAVFPMAAAAMKHDHHRSVLAGGEIMDEKTALTTVVLDFLVGELCALWSRLCCSDGAGRESEKGKGCK